MKKTISFFLIITFIIVLSGCQFQNANNDISSQIFKASERALEITDSYLNYEITKEEAVEQLEDIHNRLGDNLTTSESICEGNIYLIKSYIDGEYTYNQIVAERNDLAECIGKSLLEEPELVLNETVQSEDGVYFNISPAWEQEDENSLSYKTSYDINISLNKYNLKENETAQSIIQKQIQAYEDNENGYVHTENTKINDDYACIIEYETYADYDTTYEKTLLFHCKNYVYFLSVYSEVFETKRCDKIFEQMIASLDFE